MNRANRIFLIISGLLIGLFIAITGHRLPWVPENLGKSLLAYWSIKTFIVAAPLWLSAAVPAKNQRISQFISAIGIITSLYIFVKTTINLLAEISHVLSPRQGEIVSFISPFILSIVPALSLIAIFIMLKVWYQKNEQPVT